MSTSTYETINAKDKPIAEDFVYVYSEIEDGGFRKVSKAMLKVLLGVATKLSELENDKAFITKTVLDLENYYLKSDTYSKDEIDNRISLIPRFDVQVVSSLPTTNISETTVYLVSSGDDSDNLYTEYINVNGLWEILGTQKIASVENAVLYTEQSLTEEQKTQARINIGAVSEEDVSELAEQIADKANQGEVDSRFLEQSLLIEERQPKGNYLTEVPDEYITESELSEEIGSLKAQGIQQVPLFANSIEECTDTSKVYVLPDGYIYAYMETEVASKPSYTNLIPTAINSDKTPFVGDNGEKGYVVGQRLNSSGVQSSNAAYCLTGFIPVKANDVIRMKNITIGSSGYYLWYTSSFELACAMYYENYEGTHATGTVYNTKPDANGLIMFNAPNNNAVAYVRFSTGVITSDSIITVNEEIVESSGTTIEHTWANTGHAFVPADYENRIISIENSVKRLENEIDEVGTGITNNTGEIITSDEVEILLPTEAVAVVGVEFNIYHESIIRTSRAIDNYDIKCYLNDNTVTCRRYAECFRLTAETGDIGDYILTVEVRNNKDNTVIASKSMTLHIIGNTAVSGKNVLFIGDSLTFSRNGLYASEIQYNLSKGGMVSIGSQTGSVNINQIGNVKHEGYNGATVGGFLKANVTSGFTNPFYNPTSGEFDLAYFMTNQGYSKVDAVCLNLGHNNLGNEVVGVNDLKTIIGKIHSYNANIPIIISLITPLGRQDSHAHLTFTSGQMRWYWKKLIDAYLTAFDNGKMNNVYLSTPYFNVDQDNDLPTETVSRCARDTTQIVRQNDSMHPTRIGTLKMADSYYASLLYHLS